jgi:outer membrane receptor protein involved in Fe transport
VGVKHHGKKMFFGLHLYHNKLTNLITNVTTSYNGKDSIDGYRVYHRVNANKSYIQGMEAEVRYRLNSRVELKGFMVYTYGQNTSSDEPMRRIPPFHGQTSVIYSPVKNVSINVDWYYASKQERLSGGDISDNRVATGGTPAWNAGNISLNYHWKQVGLNLGIINLFNTPYRLHGSGIDGMGRSIWMSIRAGF